MNDVAAIQVLMWRSRAGVRHGSGGGFAEETSGVIARQSAREATFTLGQTRGTLYLMILR